MKKIAFFVLCLGLLSPLAQAAEKQPQQPSKQVAITKAEKDTFKARRKLVKQLVKKYKRVPETEKPAVKTQLSQIVGEQVDAQFVYMKNRIAAERANLDNWEAKIKADEKNLDAVKAQRVEDLLSGEAKKKQKAAKKAWKAQMRKVK